jgi:transcription elongation factor GreA
MPRDVILTQEGLDKLKEELELLATDKRREVAQPMLEQRIAQLEDKLRAAQVIDAKDVTTDVVGVGTVVHVKDQKTGKSQQFTIVGSAEANPAEMKLSNESPVGRALMGHKRNDIVSVPVPKGPARKLKITKIDLGL